MNFIYCEYFAKVLRIFILTFSVAILLIFIYFLMNLGFMRLAPDSHLEVILEGLFGHSVFWS